MTENEAAAGEATQHEPGSVRAIRIANRVFGLAEQALLAVFLATLVGVACVQLYANKFMDKGYPATFELIRNSVFFIAMTSAALCAQADKMISMDFVARVVTPRTRAYLGVVTRLFTIVICLVFAYGGWIVRAGVAAEDYELMKPATVLLALPIGAGMIALHTLFYLVIDLVYLSRGQTTPAPNERGGAS